jgi:hypothetical protein
MGKGQRIAPAPRLTSAEAAEAWFAQKTAALSDKTVRAYRYALDAHVLPAFGREHEVAQRFGCAIAVRLSACGS